MRSTFNVNFQVRKNRVSKDGLSPIDVVITVNTERSTMTTGKKIKPDSWDLAKQRVKSKEEEVKLINEYLQSIKNKLLECEADLLNHGYLVTASLLRDAYLNNVKVLKDKTLLEVFAEHNRQQKEMLDNGKLSKATLFISEYTLTLITDFIKDHYKRNDIYLKELNINFIKEFHLVLLKRMKQNSSTKHIKLLKKIINIAIANSDITFNPFGTYKVERDPVEIDFLDEEELRKVINFDTPLPRLEKAKDMFLFGCFTGLSYIDIKTLTKEHIESDNTGRIWIKKRRVKTGILSHIPLLPMAKMILDKYKNEDKLLPIQDPADVNKYLKDIAILCKIDKRITFHTSRHTFASTVTLSNNISGLANFYWTKS